MRCYLLPKSKGLKILLNQHNLKIKILKSKKIRGGDSHICMRLRLPNPLNNETTDYGWKVDKVLPVHLGNIGTKEKHFIVTKVARLIF